jgi:hypothetical protein
VLDQFEEEFKSLFGDHENPSYRDAMAEYYKNGPRADWQERYISAYATMHPWEDFAETFATYLDMVSVLDTACHFEFLPAPSGGDRFDVMIRQFKILGVGMNEINRSVGLLDLVPEVLVEPVRKKMRFVHDLIAAASIAAPAQASV